MKSKVASAAAMAAAAIANATPAAASYGFESRLLAAHNAERAAWRLPPLAWDPRLAAAASAYARMLAPVGALRHSDRSARPGQGENLWMGTRGAFLPEQMIAGWSTERRLFRPGVFPYVSRSGSWHEVGHYTQMLWPTTTRVGCGLASARGNDVLVCRYSPPGNIDGRRVPW
jgi:hypothetical protein